MHIEITIPEVELFNAKDGSSMTAAGLFQVRYSYEYSADHGGRDGFVVNSVTFTGLTFNGYMLPRAEAVKCFGAAEIDRIEDVHVDDFQAQLDAGDMVAA